MVDWKDHEGHRRLAAEAIAAFEFKPSIIVDSGNGFQCHGLFRELEEITMDNRALFRGCLLGLAKTIGGDEAYRDLGQILRFPGTRNLKDAKNPKVVRVVRFHPERRYNPSDFDPYYVEDIPTPGGPVGVPTDDEIMRCMAGGIAGRSGEEQGGVHGCLEVS